MPFGKHVQSKNLNIAHANEFSKTIGVGVFACKLRAGDRAAPLYVILCVPVDLAAANNC
jgi:hypothetical protein